VDIDDFEKSLSGKNILITGGLGSIGGVLLKRINKFNYKQLTIVDNRETELFYVKKAWSHVEKIEFHLGDVRDKKRMLYLTKDVDIIFHAAALKHVGICELNPIEAVQTNIHGTQNLIECAIDNEIEKMILISTDKAVNPTNIMGATKLAAERLIAATGLSKDLKTKFGVVRFGNVLASRGSVLEIWKDNLKNNQKISVTDPTMTRFFMSMEESANLILISSNLASRGEIFILKMPSINIGDFASIFLELNNMAENDVEVIGSRIGEKHNEELLSLSECDDLLENDELYVKLPLLLDPIEREAEMAKFVGLGFQPTTITSFSSSDTANLLSKAEISEILVKYI